ncbi:MAG: class I SAM-dependent methyltransferase, partial [Candidatus Micrarchaeota archaeon]|nr:class I SAM-dependent methyltransferase [Candidatus Micrarchaeota archaeon]
FNHLFSMGFDIGWRNEAAQEAMLNKDKFKILDLGTGTGDLAIMMQKMAKKQDKNVKIVGTDFNKLMLEHARAKAKNAGYGNISFGVGDALKTGFPASSFDVVTTAFTLRSFDNLDTFSKELYKIIKGGGKFVLLDMAKPDHNAWFMGIYLKIIPIVGGLVDKKVYAWLTSSIWKFDKHGMVKILQRQGFKNVKIRELRTGVAYIITGWKPQ